MFRLLWPRIIVRARLIVLEFEAEGTLISQRQLYYRLVAEELLPHDDTVYKTLSDMIAVGRRDGTFPALADRTRRIDVPMVFDDPDDARVWVRERYRIDRAADQEAQIILAVERDTLVTQVAWWFQDYGLPVVMLRGYGSQTYMNDVASMIAADPRPTKIIYAGDFGMCPEDTESDFRAWVPGIDEFVRVAVRPETVWRFELPELAGKAEERRANFTELSGRPPQVEVEALDPFDLRAHFQAGIDELMDMSKFKAALEREADERAAL